MTNVRALTRVLAALFVVACGPAQPGPPITTAVDSSGVVIVTHNARVLDTLTEWSLSDQPTVSVGEGSANEGDERSRFFLISGVRKLPDHRYLVATDASKQLLVFDTAGVAVTAFGRQGAGPGEFRHLDLIASSDSTSALVFDAMHRRITSIDLASGGIELFNMRAGESARVYPTFRFSDGSLFGRIQSAVPDDAPANGVFRDSERIVIVDSSFGMRADLGMHPSADVVVRQRGETFGFALDAPYSRQLLTSANDSAIVLASTGPFTIGVYSARGVLHHSIRMTDVRRPVSSAMREAYRTNLLASAANDAVRKAWEMRAADEMFPDSLPAFDQLLFDRRGDIWVRLSATLAEAQAQWLVFTTDGKLVARLTAPSAFTFHEIADGSVLGVWTDEWSREQVREYALERLSR